MTFSAQFKEYIWANFDPILPRPVFNSCQRDSSPYLFSENIKHIFSRWGAPTVIGNSDFKLLLDAPKSLEWTVYVGRYGPDQGREAGTETNGDLN